MRQRFLAATLSRHCVLPHSRGCHCAAARRLHALTTLRAVTSTYSAVSGTWGRYSAELSARLHFLPPRFLQRPVNFPRAPARTWLRKAAPYSSQQKPGYRCRRPSARCGGSATLLLARAAAQPLQPAQPLPMRPDNWSPLQPEAEPIPLALGLSNHGGGCDPSWCDCSNTNFCGAQQDHPEKASCNLCEQKWVFVLSAGGRTGSTSILEGLNALPGVSLSGENSTLTTCSVSSLRWTTW